MRIIAVDDEKGALKLLVRALNGAAPDEEVHAFMDVRAALKYAQENIVDVACLDIQMPVMTGLEAAKRLKKTNPNINIIFCTGYSEYAVEAMKLRSSGYLTKPIMKDDVRNELEHLRNPVVQEEEDRRIKVKTFGSFDIYVDGNVVTFRRERSKEMLAYLIDRRGSTVTRKELAASMFEDREYTRATQAYLTQIIGNLKKELEAAGIAELLVSEHNNYAVDTELFNCDSYQYLDGNPNAINQFHGEYMNQYSWAEESIFQFYE